MLIVKVRLKDIFAFSLKIVEKVTFRKKKDKLILLFLVRTVKKLTFYIVQDTFFRLLTRRSPSCKKEVSHSRVISLHWAPGRLDVDIVSENEHHLIARNTRNVWEIGEKKCQATFLNFLASFFTFPSLVGAIFDLMTSQTKCHLNQ